MTFWFMRRQQKQTSNQSSNQMTLFARGIRRRRQQKPLKFAYLTMKNSIFARFARAFFIFWHLEDVLVLSTTWNDLFCWCVDDVSTWWQMFNFVFSCPKQLVQFNSRTVRTHFLSITTLNNWKLIAETRSYIFRWQTWSYNFEWRFRCCHLVDSIKSPENGALKQQRRQGYKNVTWKETFG